MKSILDLETKSLILPIEIGDNKKVMEIQEELIRKGYLVGAIRQPTVSKAIVRVIIKLDIKMKDLEMVLRYLRN